MLDRRHEQPVAQRLAPPISSAGVSASMLASVAPRGEHHVLRLGPDQLRQPAPAPPRSDGARRGLRHAPRRGCRSMSSAAAWLRAPRRAAARCIPVEIDAARPWLVSQYLITVALLRASKKLAFCPAIVLEAASPGRYSVLRPGTAEII